MDEATAKAIQALIEQQLIVTAGLQALVDSFAEAPPEPEQQPIDDVQSAVDDIVATAEEEKTSVAKTPATKPYWPAWRSWKSSSLRCWTLPKVVSCRVPPVQPTSKSGCCDMSQQSLSNRALKQYAALREAIGETYSVDVTRQFNVEPSIAQELNDKITERADFLERINVVPVTEIKGQKVMFGVNGPVTSRTNTKTTDREAKDVSDLNGLGYELFATESDVGLPFAKIDSWAKFPDFADRATRRRYRSRSPSTAS